MPSDAEILFHIASEVQVINSDWINLSKNYHIIVYQIFYISKSGQVSCPSYPTSLSIFRFKGLSSLQMWRENNTTTVFIINIYFLDNGSDQPAFLKVGSWVYPLVPGKSPVLKSRFGSYLFPDLDNSIEGEKFSCQAFCGN